jgi:hypothetical protein
LNSPALSIKYRSQLHALLSDWEPHLYKIVDRHQTLLPIYYKEPVSRLLVKKDLRDWQAKYQRFDQLGGARQGCSTLSIEFPVEERIGSGESGSISILTEC